MRVRRQSSSSIANSNLCGRPIWFKATDGVSSPLKNVPRRKSTAPSEDEEDEHGDGSRLLFFFLS
eukprot:3184008-Pyramimonas_sp.AAC.2